MGLAENHALTLKLICSPACQCDRLDARYADGLISQRALINADLSDSRRAA